MLLGIISDTHNRQANAAKALQIFEGRGVRQVIHCGDWTTPETIQWFIEQAAEQGITVQGVLGNNDREVGAIKRMLAELHHGQHIVEGVLELGIAGKKFAAYHGHHQPTLRKLLANHQYDAVFLGHSHKPRDEYVKQPSGFEQHVINPGSTAFAIPRKKGWQASVAIYDTEIQSVEFEYFAPATAQTSDPN